MESVPIKKICVKKIMGVLNCNPKSIFFQEKVKWYFYKLKIKVTMFWTYRKVKEVDRILVFTIS